MQYVNLTPHVIRLNDGTEFPPSGVVARVGSIYREIEEGVFEVLFGSIQYLPKPQEGVRLIVSSLVTTAVKRDDLYSPAIGHPECVRKEGRVYSVPGFVRGGSSE